MSVLKSAESQSRRRDPSFIVWKTLVSLAVMCAGCSAKPQAVDNGSNAWNDLANETADAAQPAAADLVTSDWQVATARDPMTDENITIAQRSFTSAPFVVDAKISCGEKLPLSYRMTASLQDQSQLIVDRDSRGPSIEIRLDNGDLIHGTGSYEQEENTIEVGSVGYDSQFNYYNVVSKLAHAKVALFRFDVGAQRAIISVDQGGGNVRGMLDMCVRRAEGGQPAQPTPSKEANEPPAPAPTPRTSPTPSDATAGVAGNQW